MHLTFAFTAIIIILYIFFTLQKFPCAGDKSNITKQMKGKNSHESRSRLNPSANGGNKSKWCTKSRANKNI